MPSIPIRLVEPRAGTKSITVFMVGIGVVLLVSNGGLKTALDWLRSKTKGAGIQLQSKRIIPNATAIENQMPVTEVGGVLVKPGHTTTPSGDYTTTFGP